MLQNSGVLNATSPWRSPLASSATALELLGFPHCLPLGAGRSNLCRHGAVRQHQRAAAPRLRPKSSTLRVAPTVPTGCGELHHGCRRSPCGGGYLHTARLVVGVASCTSGELPRPATTSHRRTLREGGHPHAPVRCRALLPEVVTPVSPWSALSQGSRPRAQQRGHR
jgi:hypothetical protein